MPTEEEDNISRTTQKSAKRGTQILELGVKGVVSMIPSMEKPVTGADRKQWKIMFNVVNVPLGFAGNA